MAASPTGTGAVLSQAPRRHIPVGFLASSKQNSRPIECLSHRELHDLWNKNKKILAEPAPSTSTYHSRIVAEQAAIEAALGMATLENGLQQAHISQDESMDTIPSTSPPSRTVEAKRRAIGRYHADTRQRGTTAAMGLDEAMRLEQRAHLAALEKRAERALPLPGEISIQAQRDARISAYMNVKPTESDEEDEEWNPDEEDDDEYPFTWFEDEEDDGRKDQPLIDLDDIIRVDDGRLG